MLYNYGAILQAYALQHYLRTLHKYDVQIVNFETKIQSESIRIFRKYSSNFIVNFLILCLSLWRYPQLKRKQKRVFNFKKTCLSLTKEFFQPKKRY